MIDNTDNVRFLAHVVFLNKFFSLVESSHNICAVDCLRDVAEKRGSAVGLKSLDLSGRVHVESNQPVISYS